VYTGSAALTPLIFGNDTVNPFSIQGYGPFGVNVFPFIARWQECDSSLMAVAINSVNVNCTGGNNGSAITIVTGGIIPYTYAWSGSLGTNAMANNLSAGTYSVTVNDKYGNNVTTSVTISQPNDISIAINTSNITCNGANNGNAIAKPIGGTLPYTYLWSGGLGTNASISGLSVGAYTVAVSDSCGDSETATASITQPTELQVTIYILDSSRSKSIAAVNASGGTSPYTYLWTGGATTDTIKSLSAGIYSCTITDANNCTATASVTIVPAGISNITDNTGQVGIYPNPNNGEFLLILQNANKLTQVEIYNMLGEKVYSNYQITKSSNHQIIKLSN